MFNDHRIDIRSRSGSRHRLDIRAQHLGWLGAKGPAGWRDAGEQADPHHQQRVHGK
jgi:hypothetical protein